MQSVTGSIPSRANPTDGWELLSRLVRYFRRGATEERPPNRWAELKPVDFEGEDTSLTQEHIELMK